MKKLQRLISRFLKIGTLLSTLALVLSVVVQIYSRFFMENAPSWTEEASRLFFIYSIAFASGIAFRQHYFVSLDLITSRLSPRGNAILEIGINSLIFVLFMVVAIYSIPYIIMGLDERSPSLGLSMAISFMSIFVMALSISFFSFVRFRLLFKNIQ